MKIKGVVHKFGNDVNTDEIIPARYLHTHDPAELAEHCMQDADSKFVKKVKPGDIIVAGENFGCGSSREHAPIAIKAVGVSCVIAESFSRIFYRNAINIGLPIFTSVEAAKALKNGDKVEVSLAKGEINKVGRSTVYK
ncbi:MAG: 3-isopropylmalate dehydratase small subunit, partial [Candidatus Omnitrophica bacterium]|nr:3-isopropylmalate dehydratase small subunit [Candidatus Omnitrophota bacterium]